MHKEDVVMSRWGWTEADLDKQRKAVVLELLRGEIISFVSF